MTELSEEAFEETFSAKMEEIKFDSSLFDKVPESLALEITGVETAFRNDRNSHEHHLLKTNSESVFFVFVKDLKNKETDYYILDLNKVEGMDEA